MTVGARDGVFKSATIVGLGLIGGSIARDLAAKGVRVRGFDADRDTLDAAVRDGVVSDPLDTDFDGARSFVTATSWVRPPCGPTLRVGNHDAERRATLSGRPENRAVTKR